MEWWHCRFHAMQLWEWLLLAAGAVCMVWCSPLVSLVWNTGSVLGMALGGFGILTALFLRPLIQKFWNSNLFKTAFFCCTGLVTVLLVISVWIGTRIICAAYIVPQEPENVTVVVLGCYVRGTKVEKSLQRRLEAALSFLQAYPQVPCVLCGGQGKGEDISEAQAQYEWLIAHGVAKERLYLEDASHNTRENMQRTAAIIEQENLPREVVISTQYYHMYRAFLYARDAGLEPAAQSATCSITEAPTYFFREIAGIVKYALVDRRTG